WSTSPSGSGPSNVISTPYSSAACSAPAFTACQNWCWKPFETSATYGASPPAASVEPPPSLAQPASTSAAAARPAMAPIVRLVNMVTPLGLFCGGGGGGGGCVGAAGAIGARRRPGVSGISGRSSTAEHVEVDGDEDD